MTPSSAPKACGGRAFFSAQHAGAFVVTLWILAAVSALSAPYPEGGRLTEWTQPDGTLLTLKVFGDEFYSRTTTKDGYTVIFNAADNTYYYAAKSADGAPLISTGVPAHLPPVQGLARELQESKTTITTLREQNIQKLAPDRKSRWAARVKAVQTKRSRDAAGFTPISPSNPTGVSTAMEAAAIEAAAAPVSGVKVGLVILVQFPDDPATTAVDPVNFPTTVAKMNRYCNETGYTDDGNTGSVRDYFYDQSNGQLTHTQLVTTIVTMPNPRNYYNYSNYPTNTTVRPDSGTAGRMLVTDAVAQLKANGFDFSSLSVNSSNRVVATSLLFAGSDSGVWAKGLWPHAWSMPSPGINVGTSSAPRYVYGYQCTNLANAAPPIGTVCHELGHLLLGFPDLYDYDDDSEGVGQHCLMASANHLNSGRTPGPINLYFKDICGWANVTDITAADSLDASLPTTGNQGYRIRKPGSTTEYFMIENRGAGDRWAANSPDKGIAIWHIDENVDGNDDQQMTAALHYQVSIEQADGAFDLENNRDRGDSADLYDVTTRAFNNTTTPNAHWWDGAASGISIAVLSSPGASMNVRFGTGSGSSALSLSPAGQSVPAAGATPSFTVTSTETWTWSADATWVTSTEATSQTGNQTFTYTVAANTGASSRTATITLTAGVVTTYHTITQEGSIVDDHGNSISLATVVGANSTTAGNFDFAGDEDYFRINVSAAGNLVLSTTGSTDTYGHLLNSSGTELTSDDDTGASTNFQITYAVTAGTYYVRVRNYYPDQTGAYQLVSTLSAPTLSASPTTQAVVAAGATHSFTVTSNGTWSWTDNATWVTSTEATSQTSTQTFTYTVAANTTNASRSAIVTLISGSLTATHTITQAGVPDDHGNTAATATVVAVNSTTDGSIETTGDSDFFRINVTAAGVLMVSSTGSTNTYGELRNSSNSILASDDDSGDSTNFQISQSVVAGTYYVRVRHLDTAAGTGTYQFVSNLTLAPNLTYTWPPGWSNAIVVSKTTGTTTDSTDILNIDALYIDYAVINNGSASTGGPFNTEVYVDEILRETFTESNLAAGSTTTRTDYYIGKLDPGLHVIRIKMDAQGGISEMSEGDNQYTRSFAVGVASNDADLASLTTSSGTLIPSFNRAFTSYTMTVPNSVTSIAASPTLSQANATVSVNGANVASGGNRAVTLNVGSNTITAVVTAQDRTTTKSYEIKVIRQTHRESWREQYFGTATNAGNAADSADSDNDGIANNLEYPFGLSPVLPDSQMLPQPQKVGNNLVITFTQPAGVTGVTYGAVWSTSLATGSWQPVTDTGSGNTHTFSVPMTTSPMFMRLTVTTP